MAAFMLLFCYNFEIKKDVTVNTLYIVFFMQFYDDISIVFQGGTEDTWQETKPKR